MYYLLLFLTQVQPSIKNVGFSPDFQCKRNENLGRVEIRVHTIFMVGYHKVRFFPPCVLGTQLHQNFGHEILYYVYELYLFKKLYSRI